MIFMYGRANGNSREATRLYQGFFLDRQQQALKFLLHCISDLQRLIALTETIARNNTD